MTNEVVLRDRPRQADAGRAVIAGFVALGVSTVALVIVSGLAGSIGEVYRGQGFVFDWLYELTHNEIVEAGRGRLFASLAIHLLFGMVWALLYAFSFEPRLRQYPGWLAGALFAMLPWVLSILVFPFVVGAGLVWTGLGAGPLPILGNLLLHLIYGATLGAGYSAAGDRIETLGPEREQVLQRAAMGRAESGAARGILLGLLGGGLVGVLLGAVLPFSSGEALVGNWSVALGVAGALAGGAVGALIGSMTGLTAAEPITAEAPPSGAQPISAALLPLGVVVVVAGLIVTIGSLLLMVAPGGGDPHLAREAGQYYYLGPIILGLLILTVVVGVATLLHNTLPRPDQDHRH